jgi:hypothetical protein
MRCSNPPANSGADNSGIPAISSALGFVALICATVVGYEFTSKGDQRNLTDYGYAEELDDPQAHSSPAGIAAATCPAASAALSGPLVDGAHGTAGETISQMGTGSSGLLTTARSDEQSLVLEFFARSVDPYCPCATQSLQTDCCRDIQRGVLLFDEKSWPCSRMPPRREPRPLARRALRGLRSRRAGVTIGATHDPLGNESHDCDWLPRGDLAFASSAIF